MRESENSERNIFFFHFLRETALVFSIPLGASIIRPLYLMLRNIHSGSNENPEENILLRYTTSGLTSVIIFLIFEDLRNSGEAYHILAPLLSFIQAFVLISLYGSLSPRSLSDVNILKSNSSDNVFTIFLQDWIGPPALYPGSYQSEKSNIIFLSDIIFLKPVFKHYKKPYLHPSYRIITTQEFFPILHQLRPFDKISFADSI